MKENQGCELADLHIGRSFRIIWVSPKPSQGFLKVEEEGRGRESEGGVGAEERESKESMLLL